MKHPSSKNATRPPRAEQRASILALARHIEPKPMLIGRAALHLGWWATLPDTEALCEEMVREGALRHATKAELASHGLKHGYLAV